MKPIIILAISAVILAVVFIRTTDAIPSFDDDSDGADQEVALARARRFTCNDWTGDFLCAGWPGAWRCQCGSACYNKVCTCKRCIRKR